MASKVKHYSKQIIIRLSEEEYDSLDKIREKTGIPVSQLIRKEIPFLIMYYGKQHGNSNPDNSTN